MIFVFNHLVRWISPLYMNRRCEYDGEYFANNHLKRINSFYGFFIRLYYRWIAKHCMIRPSGVRRNGRVLDVGCGVGALVKQFRELGYDACGIDVNKAAIENSVCPENCFLVKSASELDYPENYFDLVVSREVLEHIPESEIDGCIKTWDRIGKGKMVHIIAVTERGACAINDPTHINMKSEQWWIDKFREYGYDAIKRPGKLSFIPFGSSGYLTMTKKPALKKPAN